MSTDIATEKPEAAPSSAALTEDHAAAKTEEGSAEKDVEMGDDERKDLLKACRQVEFYFADSNLPYDRFMWTLHTKTPEHWVPISTVASFKRMREHTARGLDWVVKAVRLSEELELDAEGVNVRRTTEVQEPKDQFERSIYAKGFGDEDSELQGKLEAFFDKYGKTNAVRLRRGEKKVFKGSVFVEFTDFKSVDAFLNAEPKPTWEGKELLIMSKQAYCDMKIKEKGLTGKAAVHRKELINRRGFNAFQENNEPERKPVAKAEVFLEFMGKKIRVQQDVEGNGTVKEEDVPFVSGASLKFEGCDGQVDFQHIKKSLKDKFSRSPFIKYNKGENHGLVGFDKALSTEEIDFVKETLKTLNDKEITWAVASEEEDKALQIERAQFAARSILTHAQDSKGGRGGGRGGRGGGRGGRGRGGRGGRGGPHGGGRGGSRNRERTAAGGEPKAEAEEQAGDKRKRAVEPDGGPDVGVRGTKAPPSIQPAKKTKVDDTIAS